MGTYGMRGNKKGAAEFEAHSCFTTGIKHDTCLKKEKRIKRETRGCQLCSGETTAQRDHG